MKAGVEAFVSDRAGASRWTPLTPRAPADRLAIGYPDRRVGNIHRVPFQQIESLMLVAETRNGHGTASDQKRHENGKAQP